ncbi:MAG: DEAD/DEAH box helicase family protein [Ignavibacteriaceae bacterium]|nr:DEAD/DEAH box helicase family protein [Ignavibacteriaceae bacterium]
MKQLSAYQAKYFAFELTRRYPSGSNQKVTSALLDARVDLNPHQVDAALFALKSPLSKGAILADEVGLGKTIEAGILLSQFRAEQKRRLLIICPANLRKQWNQELLEKFFLDSMILETSNFKEMLKSGKHNPFDQNRIVICSFQFARSQANYLSQVNWELCVIDEAHRLRNVYKPNNKIGNAIKNTLVGVRKILLTATPLQNSLLELYGLVSIIDEFVFGEIKDFRNQFMKNAGDDNHHELRDRLKTLCIRNLRRQVQEYIKFTNRIPLTIRFEPTEAEHQLYTEVSEYLRGVTLYALPASQRHLMTLILRKLLASSTYAIAGTLAGLVKRLQELVEQQKRETTIKDVLTDFELFDDYEDESENDISEEKTIYLTQEELTAIEEEIKTLNNFRQLAESIRHNAKGEKLLLALKEGFAAMDTKAARKAIIFTESTRTQFYLYNLLEELYPGKIVLFNGSNSDEFSNKIYRSWFNKNIGSDKITGSETADKRSAIVEYFRDEAEIMIATEAAAEGINLQFCSLIINYDLPWNPQRIEQRIGRCHRYGQKYDVVVVNFLNIKNAADVRVFQLLDEKFRLFSGVFGASDDVLGSIESGVDFEKRIAEIYQNCRTDSEITRQFDNLQKELENKVNKKMLSTRETLLANFDDEVIEKLKLRLNESKSSISKYEKMFWTLLRFELDPYAEFSDDGYRFKLNMQPVTGEQFPLETYSAGFSEETSHHLRPGHNLARRLIERSRTRTLRPAKLTFNLTGYKGNIAVLTPLINKSGWLCLQSLTISSFETADFLIPFGETSDGIEITEDQILRMLTLPVQSSDDLQMDLGANQIEKTKKIMIEKLLNELSVKDNAYLQVEMQKLHKWADDRIASAEQAIKDTKARIKELNREVVKTTNPEEQLALQEQLKKLASKQKKQRQEIFRAEDEIAERRDGMILEIKKRMKQEIREETLFTIEWNIL